MWARLLVAATIVWPMVAGGALWQRVAVHQSSEVRSSISFATVVYLGASRICHQRPERSFATRGVAWPVCARCAGLYLAAPFGAVFALGWSGRRRRRTTTLRLSLPRLLMVAAVPTALTLVWEWGGLGMPAHIWRFLTALPLGAALAFALVKTTSEAAPTSLSHS